jgi:predicted Zn-dependent peptidase
MKDLQSLVYKFMEKEEVTLKQALMQSSLGACAKTGDLAEIVRGVVYNGYPYSDERKARVAEHLGELLFYWVMLASTTGFSPDQIMAEYIAAYIKRTKVMTEEEFRAMSLRKTREEMMQEQSQASIIEMLKYVKAQEAQEKKLREQLK